MYKNILVPIDLAHKDQADAMIKTALAIGGADVKITLFYAIPEIPAVLGLQLPPDATETAKTDVEAELNALAASSGASQKISVATRFGRPHQKILALTEEQSIDLIVMASHQPGLADFLLGSVAANVIRHAKCSVHVMR